MTNWLDRTITWLSPNAGLKRVRSRVLANQLLNYEGVRSPRRMGGWNTTGSSGNSEIGVASSKLRSNAHDLCRNNAYARKAKREWAKRVVGTGITPRPDSGSDSVDRKTTELWGKWSEQCCSDSRLTFSAAQKLIVSSCYESGEVLVRLWDRRLEDGLTVPFQIQVLEADYLDETKTMNLTNGFIVQGVQFDPIGRITGYWLFGNHPGEVIATSFRGNYASAFIPAQYVLHHLEHDRPGDVRAVTRFAAVISKLRDIDEYEDAEIVRKKIEACLAAMVTQPEGIDGPTMASTAVDATTGLRVEEMRPGMIMYGAPGADVKFFSPQPAGDYSEYKKTELREVAAGLEIPYVVLDDNLEAVNYSSYRGGLLAFRDAIDEYRWNWLIPQVLNPIWRSFIAKIFAMGEIPLSEVPVCWDPPPFDLLDREAEAKADRMELQIGKKTWPQLVGEQGNDPEAQIAEIQSWKSRLEEAGVTFASTTSNAGAANAKETNQAAGTNANPDTGSAPE
jgi:lambda family phage portal protein